MENDTRPERFRPIWEYGPEAQQVLVHLEDWLRRNPGEKKFRGRYIIRHLEDRHGLEPEITRDTLWELLGPPGSLPEQM